MPNYDNLRKLDDIERDVLKSLIRQFDLVDRKVKAKKALAEVGDAITHAGLTWDDSARVLVFYASRFTGDQPDVYGDVIDPGAFDDWYRAWKAAPTKMYKHSNGKLPIVFAHQWDRVDQVIGWAAPEDVTIDAKGLLIGAHLFDTPEAQRCWELARDMGLGASFAFDVDRNGEGKVTRNGKTFNLIRRFSKVLEAGPCLHGAEASAGTVGVKAVDRAVVEFDAFARDVARKHGIKSGLDDSDLEPTDDRPRCFDCGKYLGAVVHAGGWTTNSGMHVPPVGYSVCTGCSAVNPVERSEAKGRAFNRALDALSMYEYEGYERAVVKLLRKSLAPARKTTPTASDLDRAARNRARMDAAIRETKAMLKRDLAEERRWRAERERQSVKHAAYRRELDAMESAIRGTPTTTLHELERFLDDINEGKTA